MDIRDQIKRAMTEQGVSQGELSRRTGIASHNLNRWLAGRRDTVRSDALEKILDALDLSLSASS